MSRKRFIVYDQITVEIHARHDLTPADSREVLSCCRDIRRVAEETIIKSIPEYIQKHINIKIT